MYEMLALTKEKLTYLCKTATIPLKALKRVLTQAYEKISQQ